MLLYRGFQNGTSQGLIFVVIESKISKLPGDVCKHCNKCCTAKGKQSEAIQCEIFTQVVKVLIKSSTNY